MQQDFDPRDLEPTLPSEEPKGRRWLPATIALVALGGFSGIVWYAYNQGASTSNGGAVPLVQADAGPLKTRPTDPGGMEVPNQDKLILNGQMVDAAGGRVERLLPPPEAPMAKPAAPPAQAQAQQQVPPALNAPRPAAPVSTQAAAPILVPAPPQAGTAAPRAAPAAVPAPQPVVARPTAPPSAPAAQAPAPIAAKPPAVAPAPAATPVSAGRGGKVQLGAVKSEAAASSEWAKLQKTHPELAALSMSVAKVEIPNKGTYYRIQAGPASDPSAVCGAVKARGQDCLVVR